MCGHLSIGEMSLARCRLRLRLLAWFVLQESAPWRSVLGVDYVSETISFSSNSNFVSLQTYLLYYLYTKNVGGLCF